MTPEAQEHLDRPLSSAALRALVRDWGPSQRDPNHANARQFLAKAKIMIDVDLADEAGRAAYLAAFHAAQALIFERTGKTTKTHAGVHSQFSRLVKDESVMEVSLRRFLSQAYDLKTIADYATGQVQLEMERATSALETAGRFVDRIEELIKRK